MQALMIARLLIISLMLAGKGFACSCASLGSVCSTFTSAKVVFTGKILAGHEEKNGRFTHYLVKVEEVFRGLNPEQKEVFIDPDLMPRVISSCYSPHEIGKQYLFFADFAEKEKSVRESFQKLSHRPSDWPKEWDVKLDLKVYRTGYCSGTKLLEHAGPDLEWLRRAVKEKIEERDRTRSWCEVR